MLKLNTLYSIPLAVVVVRRADVVLVAVLVVVVVVVGVGVVVVRRADVVVVTPHNAEFAHCPPCSLTLSSKHFRVVTFPGTLSSQVMMCPSRLLQPPAPPSLQ